MRFELTVGAEVATIQQWIPLSTTAVQSGFIGLYVLRVRELTSRIAYLIRFPGVPCKEDLGVTKHSTSAS